MTGGAVVPGLAEGMELTNGPEELEREVRLLVDKKVEESGSLDGILKLASLYLDLGYGFYADPKQKLAVFREGARLAKKAWSFERILSEPISCMRQIWEALQSWRAWCPRFLECRN